MPKFKATSAQITRIKQAIKRHNMRAVKWQAIAARPDLITEFLRKTEA